MSSNCKILCVKFGVYQDFFTLTELKDGLTSPERVNELIALMQKEKDCVITNVSEASRQWSTVANVITVTKRPKCLDPFFQLNGILIIDKWINDSWKFGNDSGNLSIKGSTSALLRALDRLQIDNHMLVSSGIGNTVQNLVGCSSSMVREKAKGCLGPGVDNVVGAVIETNLSEDTSDKNEDMVDSISIESDGSEKDIVGQSEDGSRAGSQLSEPSVEGKGGGVTSKGSNMVDPIEIDFSEKCDNTCEKSKRPDAANGNEPKLSEVDQRSEAEATTEKGSLEDDGPTNLVSAAISVVPTSHVAPLQYEGNHGWKGSAATSAFHVPESSFSRTNSNSKQHAGSLDFDLNVANDNKAKNPIISNSLGDGSVIGQSPSQSSSTSSKPPSIGNIGLNVNLSLNLNKHSSFTNVPPMGHQNATISLFGNRIQLNQPDPIPQPNARFFVPHTMDMYYSPYVSLGTPASYMVDPRVVPVAPQFVGSASATLPAYFQQPLPFFMSMTSVPSFGPNETGSSQHNMALDSGFMVYGGNSGGSSSSVASGKRKEPDG
ncbi:Transcription factor IIS [Artemisia annua]|uniref:Transcription factor IIS n=1 Tax=Artemisia annua TaxID=35608 RepID=A0A2U1NAG3_ARTAN|nr:Transcription factor IIS [Artemisia annua]